MKLSESLFQVPGVRRGLRFYLTGAVPCPYLPGQIERKGFTHLSQEQPDALHDQLTQAGFRRSQAVAYRPACPACNACKSVRVDVAAFGPSASQRRTERRNQDLVRRPVEARATREQFRLLQAYLNARHKGGGMSEMGFREYCAMVNDTPVQTVIFEYRLGHEANAPLVAAALSDVLRDGLSMVYTFFDPNYISRSLGTYLILDHIRESARLGLPHTYLGYWIKGSDKMDYKRNFAPLEVLEAGVWQPLDPITP